MLLASYHAFKKSKHLVFAILHAPKKIYSYIYFLVHKLYLWFIDLFVNGQASYDVFVMFDIADLSPNFVTSLFEHFDGDNEIIIPFDLNSHIYDFIEISILLKVMGKTGLSTFLVNDNNTCPYYFKLRRLALASAKTFHDNIWTKIDCYDKIYSPSLYNIWKNKLNGFLMEVMIGYFFYSGNNNGTKI